MFPVGEPFKCLYALHALREHLSTRRLKSNVSQASGQNSEQLKRSATEDQEDALSKGMSLIVAAICDPELVERCPSDDMRTKLSLNLIDNYVYLLKGMAVVLSIYIPW